MSQPPKPQRARAPQQAARPSGWRNPWLKGGFSAEERDDLEKRIFGPLSSEVVLGEIAPEHDRHLAGVFEDYATVREEMDRYFDAHGQGYFEEHEIPRPYEPGAEFGPLVESSDPDLRWIVGNLAALAAEVEAFKPKLGMPVDQGYLDFLNAGATDLLGEEISFAAEPAATPVPTPMQSGQTAAAELTPGVEGAGGPPDDPPLPPADGSGTAQPENPLRPALERAAVPARTPTLAAGGGGARLPPGDPPGKPPEDTEDQEDPDEREEARPEPVQGTQAPLQRVDGPAVAAGGAGGAEQPHAAELYDPEPRRTYPWLPSEQGPGPERPAPSRRTPVEAALFGTVPAGAMPDAATQTTPRTPGSSAAQGASRQAGVKREVQALRRDTP